MFGGSHLWFVLGYYQPKQCSIPKNPSFRKSLVPKIENGILQCPSSLTESTAQASCLAVMRFGDYHSNAYMRMHRTKNSKGADTSIQLKKANKHHDCRLGLRSSSLKITLSFFSLNQKSSSFNEIVPFLSQ